MHNKIIKLIKKIVAIQWALVRLNCLLNPVDELDLLVFVNFLPSYMFRRKGKNIVKFPHLSPFYLPFCVLLFPSLPKLLLGPLFAKESLVKLNRVKVWCFIMDVSWSASSYRISLAQSLSWGLILSIWASMLIKEWLYLPSNKANLLLISFS